MRCITALCLFFRAFLVNRSGLALENLALRQQLGVFRRSAPRPRIRCGDRVFWAWLSRWWPGWRSVLVIVSPATVVRWHRQGFRLYWRRKSMGAPGRPGTDAEVRRLIRRMSRDNPLWGAPRIRDELRLLGHDVAASTAARYMGRRTTPPSPTWRSFLRNHAGSLASIDFFVVPTVTFRLVYGLVVLRHDRRRVVHYNVTARPTAAWVAQQIREAFPFEAAPRFLIRDNDGVYGDSLREHLEGLGIEEVRIAPRSPWQNPFVERLIGSIRRECLDHVLVPNESHLKSLLGSYFSYYNHCRTHRSLDGNAPCPREVEPAGRGQIVAVPQVGGLHHRYTRAA